MPRTIHYATLVSAYDVAQRSFVEIGVPLTDQVV